MDDELLDLVDRSNTVIGTLNRNEYARMVRDKLGYFRAVDMYIVNSRGQLFVPLRTAHKTIAPNGYDYSVGGHVGKGEDYMTALIREAREELGLDIDAKDVEFVATRILDGMRYINQLYIMRSDSTPTINPEDFVSASWREPMDLLREIKAGHPAKIGMVESVELIQAYLDKTAAGAIA
ncbi:MAG TPA: NUDIX domain-containing protein [Candidatus Saccharimonadales bacterium]|nr:NUDIX domain-containing protein [Candidatus Saccharimonadales bacterium]